MTQVLFLYHDPCTDGFLCRIIAEHFYKHSKTDCNVTFAGVNPSCLTADLERILQMEQYDLILMFDVSLTMENYKQLANHSKEVRVFDHHESTVKSFNGIYAPWLLFDNEHCGSYLAFKYFYGDALPVPKIVQYVQVRDIWLFGKTRDLPNSKEITTYLYNEPFRMPFQEACQYFFLLFDSTDEWWQDATKKGRIILNQVEKAVDSIVASMKQKKITVLGVERQCLVANTSDYVSEVGNKCTSSNEHIDFALLWVLDTENRIRISLRSNAKKCNVNDVARELWNGGGHAAAAGALLSDEVAKTTFLNQFSN